MDPADVFISELESATSINNALSFIPVNVCPGDNITESVTKFGRSIKIGTGMKNSGDSVLSFVAGTINYKPPTSFWIESNQKFYTPKSGDQVLGVIEDKGADFYKVNIFSGGISLLNRLSFEGASKRNKPELKKGDVVYARITLAHKDLDTELTCITGVGSLSKKEWSTGETVYGELSEGLLLRVPIASARNMLQQNSAILNSLSKHFAFEVVIGMNGAVWIKGSTCIETVVIRNCILNAEHLSDVEVIAMVDQLATRTRNSRR